MKYFALAAILLTCFVFFGLVFAQEGPESVVRGTKPFRKTVLVSGLAGPWEVTWGPDNMLWVTERTGKLFITARTCSIDKRSVVVGSR